MAQPFTSILHPFSIDQSKSSPGKGSIAEETNYSRHIEQMMLQVLFTAPGERINRPDFGCGIKRLIFAPNSEISTALAQVTIYEALTRWLGTAITVNDVTATSNNERLEVGIVYTLKTQNQRRYLNLDVTL